MITFGSLFAGIGGFDLGFERCGMQCKWQVEIDDYATRILERHWPDVHRQRDIKQCGRHNLEPVDVICGGFPCQDISYAGKGAGLDGERSGLFFEAIRLVCELRPRAIVLENVAGLLTRGLDRVLGTLASLGFDAEWHCIPAAAVGAPHIRDRVFVLAYAEGQRHGNRRGQRDVCEAQWRQNDELLRQSGGTGQGTYLADPNSIGRNKRRKDNAEHDRDESAPSDQQLVSDPNSPRLEGQWQVASRTVSEHRDTCYSRWWQTEPAMGELVDGLSGGLVRFAGRVANGIPNRASKLRCLGNAVVPQVAEVVGRILLERIGGEDDLFRH